MNLKKYPEITDYITSVKGTKQFDGIFNLLEILSEISKEPGINLVDLQSLISDFYYYAIDASIEEENEEEDPICEIFSGGVLDS